MNLNGQSLGIPSPSPPNAEINEEPFDAEPPSPPEIHLENASPRPWSPQLEARVTRCVAVARAMFKSSQEGRISADTRKIRASLDDACDGAVATMAAWPSLPVPLATSLHLIQYPRVSATQSTHVTLREEDEDEEERQRKQQREKGIILRPAPPASVLPTTTTTTITNKTVKTTINGSVIESILWVLPSHRPVPRYKSWAGLKRNQMSIDNGMRLFYTEAETGETIPMSDDDDCGDGSDGGGGGGGDSGEGMFPPAFVGKSERNEVRVMGGLCREETDAVIDYVMQQFRSGGGDADDDEGDFVQEILALLLGVSVEGMERRVCELRRQHIPPFFTEATWSEKLRNSSSSGGGGVATNVVEADIHSAFCRMCRSYGCRVHRGSHPRPVNGPITIAELREYKRMNVRKPALVLVGGGDGDGEEDGENGGGGGGVPCGLHCYQHYLTQAELDDAATAQQQQQRLQTHHLLRKPTAGEGEDDDDASVAASVSMAPTASLSVPDTVALDDMEIESENGNEMEVIELLSTDDDDDDDGGGGGGAIYVASTSSEERQTRTSPLTLYHATTTTAATTTNKEPSPQQPFGVEEDGDDGDDDVPLTQPQVAAAAASIEPPLAIFNTILGAGSANNSASGNNNNNSATAANKTLQSNDAGVEAARQSIPLTLSRRASVMSSAALSLPSPPPTQLEEIEEDIEEEWSAWEDATIASGLDIWGMKPCKIALLVGTRTCMEVKTRITTLHLHADDANNHAGTTTAATVNRRKRKSVISATTGARKKPSVVRDRFKRSADEPWAQFLPCDCDGPCTSHCPCRGDVNFCEKFCGCDPKKCGNRFEGCHCKCGIVGGRRCSTKQCPCMAAGRECDPDLCRTCSLTLLGTHAPGHQCNNFRLRLHQKRRVLMGLSGVQGWGAFLGGPCVKKDDFLGEYCGELIDQEEADRRGRVYDRDDNSYLFNLNAEWVIDARQKGNKLRFANHSASANCRTEIMLVDGDHRVAVMANRDLTAGEELFYDYRYERGVAPDWAQRHKNRGRGR